MRKLLFLLLLTACSSPHFQENIPIKEDKVIVIDPGHGGEDQGTETVSKPLFKEKSLTLMTARLVETALKRLGYR
ncbi:MAG: N-acetylmuramoyl-L-alanine amidase, partial [Chlamydiia bacterium]|nr:N-acetylmuramoyl-L-alanine amidase [Chlamydiia bacterium]